MRGDEEEEVEEEVEHEEQETEEERERVVVAVKIPLQTQVIHSHHLDYYILLKYYTVRRIHRCRLTLRPVSP